MSHCTYRQAAQLTSIFRDYETALPNILHEAGLGLQSAYGYQAFFRVSENQAAVTSLCTKINDTASIVLPNGQDHRIVFFCINEGDTSTAPAYEGWLQDPYMVAASDGGTYGIWLLPPFWHHPQGPPDLLDCPSVWRNKIKAGTVELTHSMWSIILHELGGKYLHNLLRSSPSGLSEYPEVYAIQQCINLPAEKQVWNAQNFAMFAAGTSRLPHRYLPIAVHL